MSTTHVLFPNPSKFISALCDPGNLFILGAGASSEFMPPGNAFLRNIGTLWIKGEGFSPRSSISKISKRLLQSRCFQDGLDAALIGLIPDRGAEWIVSYLLSPSTKVKPYLSYEVFKRLARPFTIANYNHDALARLSLGGLSETRILEPHGSTYPGLKELFDEVEIQEYADMDIPAPNADNFIMLKPEPSKFAHSPFFNLLDRTRSRVQNVIFIGYSFSLQQDGIRDDAVSYDYFTDYLQGKRTFVVMPEPHKLVEELSGEMQTRDVYGVPLRWDLFSQAVFSSEVVFSPVTRATCLASIPKLISIYQELLEKAQSREGIK